MLKSPFFVVVVQAFRVWVCASFFKDAKYVHIICCSTEEYCTVHTIDRHKQQTVVCM